MVIFYQSNLNLLIVITRLVLAAKKSGEMLLLTADKIAEI